MTIVTPQNDCTGGRGDNCHPPCRVHRGGGVTIATPPQTSAQGGRGDNCHPPQKYCTGRGVTIATPPDECTVGEE